MSLLERLKTNWIAVLIAGVISVFVLVGQFSDALKKTGLLCKTPVDAVLDCIDNSRVCQGLSAEVCAILKKRYGEVERCSRGCSPSRP